MPSPARSKSAHRPKHCFPTKRGCSHRCHGLLQDAVRCFAVDPVHSQAGLPAQVSFSFIKIIVHDARVGDVVVIGRQPPPERARDRAQIGKEMDRHFERSAKKGTIIQERREYSKVWGLRVEHRPFGFAPAQTTQFERGAKIIGHNFTSNALRAWPRPWPGLT
jgi:hypothetical protein